MNAARSCCSVSRPSTNWPARLRYGRRASPNREAQAARLENSIERASRRLVETDLTAPFPAYVTDVTGTVGRMVGSNDKVATLIDREWIEARFNLTDDQFGRIVAKRRLSGRPPCNGPLGAR